MEQQHILPREELSALLDGQCEELSAYLFPKADRIRRKITVQISMCAVLLNLPIIAETTAITVESATAIQRPTDIALQQNRFYPVVKPDGTWDFVHLYYREERILITQM